MPFDVNGNFVRDYNWQQDRDNGIRIMASRMDGEFDNYAGGMNQTFLRSGLVPMEGPILMNGNPIRGIASGTTLAPGLTFILDPTSGYYQPGVKQLGVLINSIQRGLWTETGLAVAGSISASGNFTVAGSISASGNFTVAGDTTFTGNITAADGMLDIVGNATISGTLTVATLASNDGTLEILGNTSVGGTFSVAGTSDFNAVVNIDANLDVLTVHAYSNVQIDGTTGISGNLGVAGAITAGSVTTNAMLANSYRVQNAASVAGAGIWGIDAALAFNTDGIERGRFNSNGLIVAADIFTQHLTSSSGGQAVTLTSPGLGNVYIAFTDPGKRKGYIGYGGADDTMFVNSENGILYLASGAFSQQFVAGGALRMIIKANGAIGMNVADPETTLHVRGDLLLPVDISSVCAVNKAASNFVAEGVVVPHYGLQWSTLPSFPGGATAQLSGYGGIKFYVGGAEAFKLSNIGDVFSYGARLELGRTTTGRIACVTGTIGNTGYIEFLNTNGSRQGYIGFATQPVSHITYSNDNAPGYGHQFVGPIIANNSITIMDSGPWINKNVNTGSLNLYGGMDGTDGGYCILRGSNQPGYGSRVDFGTSGVLRMNIDPSGYVIMGMVWRAPAAQGTLRIVAEPTNNSGISFTTPAPAGYAPCHFETNGTFVGRILCTATNTSYATSCDETLKDNISDATSDTGAIIDATRIVEFDWKVNGEHQRFGVIAQQVNEVYPEAISPGDEEIPWAGDMSKFVPVLIKELQMLRKRVAYLEGYGEAP